MWASVLKKEDSVIPRNIIPLVILADCRRGNFPSLNPSPSIMFAMRFRETFSLWVIQEEGKFPFPKLINVFCLLAEIVSYIIYIYDKNGQVD